MQHPPLWLMRHGQTDWNKAKRIQGHLESDLNETGREHAADQGRILAGLDLPADLQVFCSPQKRTRQTAQIALKALDLTPVFDDRLKEIHVGEWEGFHQHELREQEPERYGTRHHFDAILDGPGETEADMRYRIGSFLSDLTGPSLIISHGVALTFLRGIIAGLDRDAMREMTRDQGVVLEVRDGEEKVWR